ncbi:MAG: hypothetical protein ACT4OS_04580 [Acidimicrobiales bacterium]
MSAFVGHSESAVGADRAHAPAFPIPYGFAQVGDERAVVASSDDDIAHGCGRTVCDPRGGWPEVAAFAACALDRLVEQGDVFVGLGSDRDRPSTRARRRQCVAARGCEAG